MGAGYAGAFASAFAWCRGGAGPPAISTVERCRVASGRDAACAPSVSTIERGRVAAGRGSTRAPTIRPVEPDLLSGSCLADREADEGHGQNREQYQASLCPAHVVHAFLLVGSGVHPRRPYRPAVSLMVPLVGRFAARASLVAPGQIFVLGCHGRLWRLACAAPQHEGERAVPAALRPGHESGACLPCAAL